mgnify:CR=1 FL=1
MDPLTIAVCAAAGVYIIEVASKVNYKKLKRGFGKAVAAGSTTVGAVAHKSPTFKAGPAKG